MTITTDIAALREEAERLGDRLAWAKLWNKDRQTTELLDAIECLQQAMETVGYAISERDDALKDFEQRCDEGAEASDVYSPSILYAA